MNRNNLKRMADYIATIPQERFDMNLWRDDNDFKHPECKSIGCVVGHCVILDDRNNIPMIDNEINFQKWIENFAEMRFCSNHSLWCFGWQWADVDNTPIGASKRIMWLLENGLPHDWLQQMESKSKLCYL